MSVDIFGRRLTEVYTNSSGFAGNRGPPGHGFKITLDGQYSVENKRLCNVADPLEGTDVATLNIVNSIIKNEINIQQQIITLMQHNIDDINFIIHTYETELQNQLKQYRINVEDIQESIARNSELISQLAARLKTVEEASSATKSTVIQLESKFSEALKRINIEAKDREQLILRNTHVISQIVDKLNIIEHGSKGSSSG